MHTRAVTQEQAIYVLEQLLAERRIAPADVDRVLARMRGEIQELEDRLKSLRGLAKNTESLKAGTRRPIRNARKRSAAQRASLREQGLYLNLMRHLTDKVRAHYKKIALSQGRAVALKQLRADQKKK